jgi:hypothetical protein
MFILVMLPSAPSCRTSYSPDLCMFFQIILQLLKGDLLPVDGLISVKSHTSFLL